MNRMSKTTCLTIVAILAVAGLGVVSEVNGAMVNEAQFLAENPSVVKLNDFHYFLDNGNGAQYTSNNPWEDKPFLVHNSVTGLDEIPADRYHFAWITETEFGLLFDAATQNGGFGYNEFLDGFYSAGLPEGYQPQDMLAVRDGADDGPGYFNTSTGIIILGNDDVMFGSQDFLFGPEGIRGDVSQIPVFTSGSDIFQPKMVLSPIPEPATMGLLTLGVVALIKRRRSF